MSNRRRIDLTRLRQRIAANLVQDLRVTSTEQARPVLGDIVDQAGTGTHTLITKNGKPSAVVISPELYDAAKAIEGAPDDDTDR